MSCCVFLRVAFACADFRSMGLRSGKYGSKYSSSWPASLITSCVSFLLWKVALSITITAFGGSFGIKSCSIHAVKTSALILTVNRATLRSVLPNNAPIALVRPFACQSCVPRYNARLWLHNHEYEAYHAQSRSHQYTQ